MTARKAIAVTDDNGIYRITLGARPQPWSEVSAELEEQLAYENDMEFDIEPLTGWDRWTWAVLVNGEAVAFVDGADEPAELPFGLVTR